MPEILEERTLSEFQLRNIQLMMHLYETNSISDELVEMIRLSELEYFGLLGKYKVLEERVNIDEKTNLLKFKPDYLTGILKTASRVYFGLKDLDYPVSFVRFDIDDFSHFNNRYGHDVGDRVLIMLATILRELSRPTDYVIRFGGEEFDVILPSTPVEGAKVYVDKIMSALEKNSIETPTDQLHVTVSAGISTMVYEFSGRRLIADSEIENLFRKLQNEADNALYEAKFLGKKRAAIFDTNRKDDYINIRKLYVKQA